MNRFTALSALMAGSVLFLGSCAQKMDDNSTAMTPDGKVTITATFPDEADSKVAASDGEESLELSWQETDYLTVVSGDVSEKYTLTSISGKVAYFEGNPVDGQSYDVILSRGTDYADRSYIGQIQSTVASTDHLVYDAVLKGVTSYESVKFTTEWAQGNGGELLQNGCLLINFKMPEDAGKLKSVALTAPSAIFYTTNSADGEKTASLALSLSDADMASDNIVRAHIMTSMQEASIPADTDLTLTVVSNIGTWSKKFTPGAVAIKAGKRNVITINADNWTVPAGDGTEGNPYILRTADDLVGMDGKLSTSEKKYFAMVKDIDMSSVTEWISISNDRQIDFNGNDRTIDKFSCTTGSYRGFIRILNGKVYNLTFTNASVDGTANEGKQPCGILAGYCGNTTGAAYGEVSDIHVQGTVTGAGSTGGLFGVIGSGKVNKCSADVTITTSVRGCGGLIGSFKNGNAACQCEISNCWTAGTFTCTNQNTGGIIGRMRENKYGTTVASVINCYSTMTMTGQRNIGGILGLANLMDGLTKVEGCIAWNSISSTSQGLSNYSSGAVIGYTLSGHTVANNYRRADMVWSVSYTDANNQIPDLFDCRDFDSSNIFDWSDRNEGWGEYYQPYHGKVSSESTISATVKTYNLGWDESIWDLSGDIPVLKR